MARSLNKAQLIGNLTRDPELRYTPSGAAVCSFSIATNRTWTTDTGEKHEEADFHRIVAWNKLAELCSQFLVKGRKVFVEGRISTRSYTAQDGTVKSITEIIISDMILLDSRRQEVVEGTGEVEKKEEKTENKKNHPSRKVSEDKEIEESAEEEPIAPDDIPF
ncbi:MAG: single-stranded DNA-binding protein [Candidatus Levybacteria bacterium CG_4_9_14_3_um_filter_35_16]|nr:MAG: single-stranded DNA-binding protein [Candidatus Levybacteria bacterium CG22_combo_CG10-13_8_21_14_all_35_11]PIY94586.1 MAG: single-stranded DNA-binding protein [Candidatus Levybacteria bacterium CG_4_10_14_0_8_um_filter_35_23]PJA90996.1 MAG: single-stranded DNA-binding protein [Candidatus Levybacteria bacterium CG_4_9_14_3_um_filter_35_16]PJC53998.1 MAG: single-stranded DNA-binding protein [Candidatus Levybacteria bacterium CG_4_9_14_0_2_um_filter_35_21]